MPIELEVEAAWLQFMIFGFNLVFWQIDNGVVLLDLHQHLFAILCDLEGIDFTDDGFLPILQTEGTEVPLGRPLPVALLLVARFISRSAAEIENTIIDDANIAVRSWHDGKSSDSISNTVEVDSYHHRLLRFDVLALVFLVGATLF